ncbi:MAG: glycosyltransferase family 2 protein [Blastocatellia bacterium]|nr:glycosyltransferase family 2 protein [Blastocatellia bacterium]
MDSSDSYNFGMQVSTGRNVFSWRPKVSVIIPAYNVAPYISETLDSVAAQKFRDFEVIVVNDGSPDTVALERAIRPHRENIIYIKQANLGAGVARNTGIKHARGEVIAFLDGDDIWLPEFLASQVAFLGRGYDMVYCDAQQFGIRSVLRRTFMESAPSSGEVTAASLLDLKCNVITSGTVATKSAIMGAGGFENFRTASEDFHLWVRMAKIGARIGYQEKVLLKYRVHLESLSGDSINRVQRGIDVFRRLRDSVGLSAEETEILDRRLASFEADLYVERGKSFLIKEEFRDAYESFSQANRYRRSLKLSLVSLAARFFPRLLLQHFRSHRADDLDLVSRASERRAVSSG